MLRFSRGVTEQCVFGEVGHLIDTWWIQLRMRILTMSRLTFCTEWRGQVASTGPVPIVRLVYGGFLPHAKLEIRSSHFPLSVARTQNGRIIISVAFCANRKSLESFELRLHQPNCYIIRDNTLKSLIYLVNFVPQNCKDHVINYSIASILHECISPRNAKGKTKGNKNKSATSKETIFNFFRAFEKNTFL